MFNWSWFLRTFTAKSDAATNGTRRSNNAPGAGSSSVGERPGEPEERPTTSKQYLNFSEADILDSGMGRSLHSALPAANLEEDLDSIEHDPLFAEEFLLAKLQEAHRQLQQLREYRKGMEDGVGKKGERRHDEKSSAVGVGLKGMLIVASFRVPLSVEVGAKGEVSSSMATGGLGLLPSFRQLWNQMPVRWLGLATWDGGALSNEQCNQIKRGLMSDMPKGLGLLRISPLFLEEDITSKHQKFCNWVLWPLFHYLPPSFEEDRSFDSEVWDAYVEVNRAYANAMVDEYRRSNANLEDVAFWIQDIHLLLVPHLVRMQLPTARIGFFLHTPFPAWEMFRTLPPRHEILQGMLAADICGFHSYDYARHWIDSCSAILGLETRPNGVYNHGVFVHVTIFPFGIDTETFREAMKKPSVVKIRDSLRESLTGKKVVIGVDRLDYIKGIPHKLLAIEYFLENNPEWIGKFVLLQVATPSRTKSKDYQRFRSEILEMVGRINGRFATLEEMPIHYLEKELTFDTLCALYSVADIALITSIRDGMNLVSYEYVVCQQEKKGVLIISEFTGAAQNLPGAIICNPWNAEEVSEEIKTALLMSETERKLRHRKLYQYVLLHSSAQWGTNFVNDLIKYSTERMRKADMLTVLPGKALLESYKSANRRLFLLDYDGTIRNFETQAELAEPTRSLMNALDGITQDPRNTVFIVTGRGRVNMQDWFSNTRIGLVVEHGFSMRWAARAKSQNLHDGGQSAVHAESEGLSATDDRLVNKSSQENSRDSVTVKEQRGDGLWEELYDPGKLPYLKRGLQKATEALKRIESFTPTTFIQEKESAVTWHFRDANPDFAMSRVHDAKQALDELLKESPTEVIMGRKILHVRPEGINKDFATRRILKNLKEMNEDPDWILVIGDDTTDEEMFHAVNTSVPHPSTKVWTCTVDRKSTIAKFYLEGVDSVLNLLATLADRGQ